MLNCRAIWFAFPFLLVAQTLIAFIKKRFASSQKYSFSAIEFLGPGLMFLELLEHKVIYFALFDYVKCNYPLVLFNAS